MKKRLLTNSDRARLNIIHERPPLKSKRLKIIEQFYNELRAAATYEQTHISSGVVTMNSQVVVKDLSNGEEFQLILTYPNQAKEEDKKISIFNPIGMALLGRTEGEEVTCRVAEGLRHFQIIKVTYQPEAVGDFHL